MNQQLMNLAIDRAIEKHYPYFYDLAEAGITAIMDKVRFATAMEYVSILQHDKKPHGAEAVFPELSKVPAQLIRSKYDNCAMV